MPDLVFACVYLFLGGLIVWLCQQNCIQKRSGNFRLIEKYVSDRFQPSLSRLSRRATLPLCRQRSGFVQSRSLERSHSVQKFDCVQVQTAALSIKSHGKSRKCMWKHHWNKMKLDFGMFAYLHTLIHIALKTQSGSPERPRNAFHCLCLQSGKTIWANVLSICRIHITSNCCRHWLGSRETWRSPQVLWCSLRHFDLSQKQEVLRLLSMLFNCFCLADVAVIRGAFCLVLDVWPHYLTDYAVTTKFWTTEFSASSARFGVRMCLPSFGPGSPD